MVNVADDRKGELEIFGLIAEDQERVGRRCVDQFRGRAQIQGTLPHSTPSPPYRAGPQSCFHSAVDIGEGVRGLQSARLTCE